MKRLFIMLLITCSAITTASAQQKGKHHKSNVFLHKRSVIICAKIVLFFESIADLLDFFLLSRTFYVSLPQTKNINRKYNYL